ncbi:MAG: hypothetical protein KA792_03990 [Bacteroidales bacterium]|nr:hypothetical protein [Bacteroidales bacterium]
MIPKIFKIQKAEYNNTIVFILDNIKDLNKIKLSKDETNFIKKQKEDKSDFITLNKLDKWYYFYFIKTDKNKNKITEEARRTGSKLQASLNKYKIESIIINDYINKPELSLAFDEGLA